MSQGTVFAASFDVESLTVTGNAVPILEQVYFNPTSGTAQFAISRNGTLVYIPGLAQVVDPPLSWLDASGRVTRIKAGLGLWGTPRFAPDGRRPAITRLDQRGNLDIWTYDIDRDLLGRMTYGGAPEASPVWTPDGSRIAFGSQTGTNGPFNLFWQRADATDKPQRLTDSTVPQLPGSWHPTRPILAFHDGVPSNPQRVMLLELEGDDAPRDASRPLILSARSELVTRPTRKAEESFFT